MPAHIGAFEKLKLFSFFVYGNIGQTRHAKDLRIKRVTTRNVANVIARNQGVEEDLSNNRAAYLPWKYVSELGQSKVSAREHRYMSYGVFRSYLDKLDPALPRGELDWHTDPREWDLYLRPGTEFDGRCQLYFEAKRGPMLVITHKSDRSKPKRIEALPKDGAPVVLWTDAS